ncbi:hypothetical protein RM844_20700 [Streptomyces sp. DSM 44915]|uniref:Uncharacterized protein n=1 Tax=Streptomyces chisholmiae TaxID=3075540 RepID=A0ABU2JUP8_9ACTN|nr:hypothetical protein [Streptomyces sp. DSM 44915]MDT0268710.1 hypothetical protein [Streptomyces sp. DSM 44915]
MAPLTHPAPRPDHLRSVPRRRPRWLESDVIETPGEHGRQLLAGLPRPGAIFAVGPSWWFPVPSGSETGMPWPAPARYLNDVRLAVAAPPEWAGEGLWAPQLIHWPNHGVPYSHPLFLFVGVCQLAGVDPVATTTAGDLTAS